MNWLSCIRRLIVFQGWDRLRLFIQNRSFVYEKVHKRVSDRKTVTAPAGLWPAGRKEISTTTTKKKSKELDYLHTK